MPGYSEPIDPQGRSTSLDSDGRPSTGSNGENRHDLSGTKSHSLNAELVSMLRKEIDLSSIPVRSYERQQVVMHMYQRPDALPIVESGVLDAVVMLGDEGLRIIPKWFEAGEIAMTSLLFSDEPILVDLVARDSANLRWIPRTLLEDVFTNNSTLMIGLIKFLAQRLREVQFRERGWLARGVRGRVCAALARASGCEAASGQTRFRVAVTHEALADWAGVSRSKLSLVLKTLEREGHVRLHRGSIEIIDTEFLAYAF